MQLHFLLSFVLIAELLSLGIEARAAEPAPAPRAVKESHQGTAQAPAPHRAMPETTPLRVKYDSKAILPPPPGFEAYREYTGPLPKVDKSEDELSNPKWFDTDELAKKGITTVDAFVKNLPEVFRRRYIPLKQSQSQHKADEKHPRVVMYNYDQDGRVVDNHDMDMVAFGTHPDDKNRFIVERIHWNKKEQKWEHSAIDFSGPTPKPASTAECVKCHTSSLRPIWDPAHNWPNAIGVRERMGIFDKNEKELMHGAFAATPILRDNFKIEDQLREDRQTPATIMFYGIFGPMHNFTSRHFVQSKRYPDESLSLIKVLAGCKDEIRAVEARFPDVFKKKEAQFKAVAEKFEFQKSGKFTKDNDPTLNPDFIKNFTAVVALFQTPEDDMGWFGKTTTKIPELYTHAFYRQDFDMLIGGICDRDPKVKAMLVRLGANPVNPCYEKRKATKAVCAEAGAMKETTTSVPANNEPVKPLSDRTSVYGPPATKEELSKKRAEVAKMMQAKCYRCHNAKRALGELSFADSPDKINEAFVADLQKKQTGLGNLMERFKERANDAKSPMPPSDKGINPDVKKLIDEWYRMEKSVN